jgi:hypothetical protein
MNWGPESWLVAIMRPPLVLLRFILSPVSKPVFGRVNIRIAKKNEAQLRQDVADALPFLFSEYAGHVVPNEGVPFPPSFDYAFVTVALDDLFLRVTRGRGDLGVNVAPAFAPSDWHELSLALSAITGQGDIQRKEFRDLWDVSRVLQPQMKALIAFFSPKQFRDLKQHLETEFYRPERIAIQEWQAEINRRLYGR